MLINCFNASEFSEHNIFKYLRQNLSVTRKISRNILQFKNDTLFAWDGSNNVLLALPMNKHEPSLLNTTLQKIVPTKTPMFEVNRVLVNNKSTKCALVGPHGICVLEIELSVIWSSDMQPGSEKTCLAKSYLLDEDYFYKYRSMMILQARWHPNCLEENILVVLTTEDVLRLYSTDTMQLLKVCALSTKDPTQGIVSKNRLLLASLGDTAVDFDFGPPLAKSYSTKPDFTYRTFILRGNGDVCCLQNLLENSHNATVEGPLAIFPPSDDNFGIDDASSILVVWSMPPILVIATSTGYLFHTLIIEDETNIANLTEQDEFNLNKSSSMYLLVFETLELEMRILVNSDGVELTNFPLTLYKDPTLRSRYYCCHQGGVHLVNLQTVLSAFEDYVNLPESDVEVPTNAESSLKYVICTRLELSESTFKCTPLLGFTIMEIPTPMMLAFQPTGQVSVVNLESKLVNENDVHDMFLLQQIIQNVKRDKTETKMKSDKYIRKLFRSVYEDEKEQGDEVADSPLFKLKVDDKKPSDQESLEFFKLEFDKLQRRHMRAIERASEHIETRCQVLAAAQNDELKELKTLDERRITLHKKAEQLAECYEELAEKKDELFNKFENIFKSALGKHMAEKNNVPVLTTTLGDKISELQKTVQQVQNKYFSVENKVEQLSEEDVSFSGELNRSGFLSIRADDSNAGTANNSNNVTSLQKFSESDGSNEKIVKENVDKLLFLVGELQTKLSHVYEKLE